MQKYNLPDFYFSQFLLILVHTKFLATKLIRDESCAFESEMLNFVFKKMCLLGSLNGNFNQHFPFSIAFFCLPPGFLPVVGPTE